MSDRVIEEARIVNRKLSKIRKIIFPYKKSLTLASKGITFFWNRKPDGCGVHRAADGAKNVKIRLLPLAVLLVALYLLAEVGTGVFHSYFVAAARIASR